VMATQPEPWLRGTLTEFDPVRRQVLHALEQAREELDDWCAPLSDDQMNARPYGLAPIAFHLRHIARSLDRLLTYAEGRALSESQLIALRGELDAGATTAFVMGELGRGLESATERIRLLEPETFVEARGVGRQGLPTTVGSLVVHCAEHTQRHAGQAITTAKIVVQI
jgi:uncharacterized damage-inducible protein DinB